MDAFKDGILFLPASGSVNAAFHCLSIIIGIKGEMDSRLCKDSLVGRRLSALFAGGLCCGKSAAALSA